RAGVRVGPVSRRRRHLLRGLETAPDVAGTARAVFRLRQLHGRRTVQEGRRGRLVPRYGWQGNRARVQSAIHPAGFRWGTGGYGGDGRRDGRQAVPHTRGSPGGVSVWPGRGAPRHLPSGCRAGETGQRRDRGRADVCGRGQAAGDRPAGMVYGRNPPRRRGHRVGIVLRSAFGPVFFVRIPRDREIVRLPEREFGRRKGTAMYEFRDAKREDFGQIAAFPQDRREAFFMWPRGSYPFTAEALYEAAMRRLLPTV